ncbi:hypothetical protein HNY73_017522 [Argiope bruennichi]|uniref:Uncharacterized protein n=3 Tax=Argiope bruennichi TaxID=94029 RepID=A0A8T0EBB4_ARGBR|nr:hypothetical protein HNY73_017522 [Argiope bruennichi]
MSSSFVVQGKVQSDLKNSQETSATKQSFGDKQSSSKVNPERSTFFTDSPIKEQKHSKEYNETIVTKSNLHTSSTYLPTTTPSPDNTSENISIDIDIDINLLSPLNTTSKNVEKYSSSTTAEIPRNREKQYEKKRVIAGVLLVILVSVSAACAVLLVLMPSKYDIRYRRHSQIPDQVALIPSRNKYRPRFYDSSLYMGH